VLRQANVRNGWRADISKAKEEQNKELQIRRSSQPAEKWGMVMFEEFA
jgi:hypothetical protein